jgi:L-asparaginase type II
VKPRIVIVATGGTIAGVAPSSVQTTGYRSAVLSLEKLIETVPGIKEVSEISGEQLFQVDSVEMGPGHWLKLSKRVDSIAESPGCDGIVVTHGTDTLEETSYFLNLALKTEKPVVVVGAMRPANSMSADGPLNLYRAVALAGSGEAAGKGVLVILDDQINAAREVTKTNTTSLDTFKGADMGFVGYMVGGRPVFYRSPVRRHTFGTRFDVTNLRILPEVAILYGYAGDTAWILESLLERKADGVVIAGPGDGNIRSDLKRAIAKAKKLGVVIARSSRTGSGVVVRNGDFDDDRYGTVAADNLNPQKARVLLMLALTVTSDPGFIQKMFWEY